MKSMPVSPPETGHASAEERPSLEAHHLARGRLFKRTERLLGLVFMAVVLLNFASAAGRYLVGRPITGADEVQVFTMIWLIFMGVILACIRRIHLRMDVLTANMTGRAGWWRALAEMCLTICVCGAMVWVSLQFTLDIYGMEQKSDAAEIPMWIPHFSAVIGFAGMTLCALFELWCLLKQDRAQFIRQPD